MKKDFDAIIFDMDGVIFDTEALVIEAWKKIANKYNIQDIEIVCRDCLGQNETVSTQKFMTKYGPEFPYAEYKAEMREVFVNELNGRFPPVKEGVREFLQFLKTKNIPIAIASSTRREVVELSLKNTGLYDYFDKIVCGDMVSHSKPHPEIFLTACKELAVEPERAYAIEDSFNGIRSAHAGNLKPIMVPDLLQPTEEIRGLAEVVLPTMTEVQKYLFEN